MVLTTSLNEQYWHNFSFSNTDVEAIYNLLLDKETPLGSDDLLKYVIATRIASEISEIKKRTSGKGAVYLPKGSYAPGDSLYFPGFNMEKGQVVSERDGVNPDFENLKVIEVLFDSGTKKQLASNLQIHFLNETGLETENNPFLDPEFVNNKFKDDLQEKLEVSLHQNDDLVKIAGNWFPRSLLVDVHIGHLNLAEAVLEEVNGGPMTTSELIRQVDFTSNANDKLLEFSFDLALQEDIRFDEVGPTGETLWFLKEHEPDDVKEIPLFLKYSSIEYSTSSLTNFMGMFEGNVFDELEPMESSDQPFVKTSISLTYPHWRSGTLPLSRSLKKMFPSAYEAPRVKFTFYDPTESMRFQGWVVRSGKYIYGLKDWYEKHELMPGSLISVEKGKTADEIIIHFEKSRQNKEWLRTVLVGTDMGFVFAMLKHPISANFNERMAVAIPDKDALDNLWQQKVFEKEPIDRTIIRVMRELGKLNPQHQVHAQELYASVNVFRRCPPSLVLYTLTNNDHVSHLGDLYFRMNDRD